MRSPVGVPPGWRVRTGSGPRLLSQAAKRLIWVVLPDPSRPSSVMKRPRGMGSSLSLGRMAASGVTDGGDESPHVVLQGVNFQIPSGPGNCAQPESNVKPRHFLLPASALSFFLLTAIFLLFCNELRAQNLTLEGQTGGFLTPTAYVVYAEKGHFFSHPAVGFHFINASKVIGNIETLSITESFASRAEVGYTRSIHQFGDRARAQR